MKWAAVKLHPARNLRLPKPKPEPREFSPYDLLYLHLQKNALRLYEILRATERTGFTGNPENRVNFLIDTKKLLDKLPPNHRIVALMYHGQGYTIDEIASIIHRDRRVVAHWLCELAEKLLEATLAFEANTASGITIHAEAENDEVER
jgi:hypothetical protein